MDRSSPPVPDSGSGTKSSSSESYGQSDANIRNFAPVARIMKSALPENAKIAKEAKECMQECVSEFISFITSEGMVILVACLTCLLGTGGLISRLFDSIREMPTRKAQNGQWRRHSVRYDLSWLRKLRRSSKDISNQIP